MVNGHRSDFVALLNLRIEKKTKFNLYSKFLTVWKVVLSLTCRFYQKVWKR